MRERQRLAQSDEVSQDRTSWARAGTLGALFTQPLAAGAEGGNRTLLQASAATQPSDDWYCNTGSGTIGPTRHEHIAALLQSGQLSDQTLVWKPGFPAWLALRDVPDLSCYLPISPAPGVPAQAKSSRAQNTTGTNSAAHGTGAWRLLSIAAAILLTLMVVITVLAVAPRNSGSSSPIGAVALNEIGQAIGIVVSGFTVTDLETGDLGEKQCGRGTCFAVSPKGHMLTAKPLVEEYERLMRAGATIEKARTQGCKVEPKLWVYLAGNRFDATVDLLSEKHDIAVLRIAHQGPYFRLAPLRENVRGARICAVGYPDAPSLPLSVDSAIQKPVRTPTDPGARIPDESDRGYVIHRGVVTDVRIDAQTVYIQISASISAANPGGPVILDDGTALGITVPVSFDNEQPAAGAKKHYALGLNQVHGELRQHVPGIFSN
jgi:S1-C subfamily serine protease